MNVPFCLPLIDEDVKKEVFSCLNDTGWLTTGPKVKMLEDEITTLCQTNATLCVNSWTSGMLLLIRWLEFDKEDEIIVPTYTYAASALSVINSGVKCVFVDVNEDFTMNMDKVKEAISVNTKAVMPVDLGGLPADYISLNRLLNSEEVRSKFNAKTKFQRKIGRPIIISDSAHSIGSLIANKPTPLYSDFSVFSFHSVKNITTGEGGAITFKIFDKAEDDMILSDLKILSLNGQNKSAFDKNSIGGWKYDILTNGLKVNMPDINAAIGLAQIRKYQKHLLPERERIFRKYNSILAQKSWAILPNLELNTRKSSCHLYQLRIRGFEEHHRNELITSLASYGIGANVHYVPLAMLSFFKEIGLDNENFPMTYSLYKNEISLPIYNGLSVDMVEYVCSKLTPIVEKLLPSEY